MAELIYTIRGQVHGFHSTRLTREVFEEALRRIHIMGKNSGNVSYVVLNGEFAGVNYTYQGLSIDVGQARNKHTSKGKGVDLIKITGSDIEKLEEVEKIFGLK